MRIHNINILSEYFMNKECQDNLSLIYFLDRILAQNLINKVSCYKLKKKMNLKALFYENNYLEKAVYAYKSDKIQWKNLIFLFCNFEYNDVHCLIHFHSFKILF